MKRMIITSAIIGMVISLVFLLAFRLGHPSAFEGYIFLWPTWLLMLDNKHASAEIVSVAANMLIYSMLGFLLYWVVIACKKLFRLSKPVSDQN